MRALSLALLSVGVICATIVWPSDSVATPIQLTEAQFDLLVATQPTLVEDFESFTAGTMASPLLLSNGVYTATGPAITSTSGFCRVGEGQCLFDQSVIPGSRKFTDFVAGTLFWGADLTLISANDVFDVTVIGGSGTLSLSAINFGSSTPFLGFQDDSGLSSVEFNNVSLAQGQFEAGNYSFDNVTTAVPEPSVAALLALGLGGLAAGRTVLRRRDRRSA